MQTQAVFDPCIKTLSRESPMIVSREPRVLLISSKKSDTASAREWVSVIMTRENPSLLRAETVCFAPTYCVCLFILCERAEQSISGEEGMNAEDTLNKTFSVDFSSTTNSNAVLWIISAQPKQGRVVSHKRFLSYGKQTVQLHVMSWPRGIVVYVFVVCTHACAFTISQFVFGQTHAAVRLKQIKTRVWGAANLEGSK
jgi:hypothetical protein